MKTTAPTDTAAVAEQGAHVAPEKAPPKTRATQKKGAPKGQEKAKSAKTRKALAPKKKATATKPAAKSAPTKTKPGELRAHSKVATILDLIRRPKGASLPEIMQDTAWQAHSVRGFISVMGKRLDLGPEYFADGIGRHLPWFIGPQKENGSCDSAFAVTHHARH